METVAHSSLQDTRHTPSSVVARSKAIYDRVIRRQLEISEDIGKVLVIDVETGAYLMGDDVNGDDDYEVALHAAKLFSDHGRFGTRISYNALDAAGGALKRISRSEDVS